MDDNPQKVFFASEQTRQSEVLIYEHNLPAAPAGWERLGDLVPSTVFRVVHSIDDYRRLLSEHDFDVIVFLAESELLVASMLLPELRFQNKTPGVLVVSDPADPLTVATLYNAGCSRLIPRTQNWLSELAQAIRALCRLKKAEDAYERTRARLTEMNVLLEEKNRRLDDFSMTVAHDIRGPLGGIAMKLEYILDSYGEDLPGRCPDLLRRALESSRRLTDVVQAMYEYAKLGAKAAKMCDVGLAELVQSTVRDLDFDQKIDVKIGIGELPNVWGNPELLRRVFANLISNAVKYNDKPEVIVNVGSDSVEELTLARFANIFVSDNGPGIPDEDLDTLFALFSRGAQARGAKEGLGVGLAVVQRIVELHYGKVRVESQVGQGTKFAISLPVERVEL